MQGGRFKNDKGNIVKNVYDLSPKQLKIFINELSRYDIRQRRKRNEALGVRTEDVNLPRKNIKSLDNWNVLRIFD
mgnify:FL=1